MTDAVIVERFDHRIELTLNRPDNRNAMTPEMLASFDAAMDRLADEPDVRVVIITGTGSSFCSGADFRSPLLDDNGSADPGESQFRIYAPFLRVSEIEAPVIAAMQGHAVGGGFGLSLLCDLRIAATDARYGANFVRLGLSPGMGISHTFPRLVGLPIAMRYLLTGELFDGAEAAAIGYANEAVPAGSVLAHARSLADAIASAAPLAVRWTKRAVYDGLDWEPATAALREAGVQATAMGTDDFTEGVAALLEKRPPRFEGRTP